MCDYSLQNVRSRPAKVGERLHVTNFGWGTRGFSCASDPKTAVCIMPGTEIAFADRVELYGPVDRMPYTTAIFRQVNTDDPKTHHDALEFPNGVYALLTLLREGQEARILQLPAGGEALTEPSLLQVRAWAA